MKIGSEILGYEVLATLGYGARSTIFAVKDQKNQVYALKQVIKSSSADQRFLEQAIQEYEVASKLNHPSLRRSLKLHRQRVFFRTREIFVLMEMVDGLTLEQFRPEGMVALCELAGMVAQGLHVVHQAGFVHADIKPNNILVTSKNEVKIIDFGQSCAIGTVKQRIQGTPDYIAPEQVLRKQITPQTDIFNFGATLYWMLTNQHAPTMLPKGDPSLTLRGEVEIRPPRELNPEVTPALSQLVMHCLEVEPNRRPGSMLEVMERLQVAVMQIKHILRPATPFPLSENDDSRILPAIKPNKK